MSSQVADGAPHPLPRRALAGRPSDTVQALLHAGVAEVSEVGFEALTIRGVARRAGLSPATAYTYFRSKEHLLAEIYWQRLAEAAAVPVDGRKAAGARVAAALAPICMAVAEEPQLAAAVTTAVLAHDPDVRALRERIGLAYGKRIATALGPDATPALMRVLVHTFAGAMISAGTGVIGYDEIPTLMEEATALMTRRR